MRPNSEHGCASWGTSKSLLWNLLLEKLFVLVRVALEKKFHLSDGCTTRRFCPIHAVGKLSWPMFGSSLETLSVVSRDSYSKHLNIYLSVYLSEPTILNSTVIPFRKTPIQKPTTQQFNQTSSRTSSSSLNIFTSKIFKRTSLGVIIVFITLLTRKTQDSL